MSFKLSPIPEVFFKVAFGQVAKEIEASAATKQLLYEATLQVHHQGLGTDAAVRKLLVAVRGAPWKWSRAEEQLFADGEEEVGGAEVLGLLYSRLGMAAYSLYRRGQIRSLLSSNMGHKISVKVFTHLGGDVAPCGRVHGEILEPTSEVLKRMPPCQHLRCSCYWHAIRARHARLTQGR